MNFKKIFNGVIGGSIVLLITINIFNALNYFFHFVMARMLNIADYGALATLMSIFYIFGIAMESIQTIITKYSSHEKNSGKIKSILIKSLRKGFKISAIFFVLYLLLIIFISKPLGINYGLMALSGLVIFSSFLLPINRGILQGKKKFNSLGFNMVFESSIKIILSVIFVIIGWKVYGAIAGVVIGAFVAFFLSFINLRKILSSKERFFKIKDIYGYSLPVFSMIATIMIFYSLDIILARAFFPGEIAGQYAIASMLAKIIFFGTFPISKAMFPLSSEASRDKNKKQAKNILTQSLLILGFGVLVALVVFWAFPELLVRIFSGSYYILSSKILIYLALAMGLLSFTNLLLLYKLSLGKIKNYWFVFIFIVFEIILLSIFHKNLFQYSITFLFLNILFLFGAIFMFRKK